MYAMSAGFKFSLSQPFVTSIAVTFPSPGKSPVFPESVTLLVSSLYETLAANDTEKVFISRINAKTVQNLFINILLFFLMIMISFHPFFEKGDITSPHFNAEEKNTALAAPR